MSISKFCFTTLFLSCIVVLLAGSVWADELPANFESSTVLHDLDAPDHLIFAPDGRMFISERITGRLLVAKYNAGNDQWVLNSQPFYTFDTPKPEPRRSGGLRSIAFDPNFANNGYIYAFYMKNGLLQNRVVRLKANPANPDRADLTFGNNGEEVLLELPFNDSFASGSHNGGALIFGTDNMLYITTGDGWTGEFAGDPVQSLTSFTGKILRIRRNGTIPSDNPFYTQTTGNYRSIYALGLRNPYSLARHPTSGKLYINEARGTNKATIYIVEAGANYGHQGTGIGTTRQPWANATAGAGGQLITGGVWYPSGGPFPASYHGVYFATLWGGNEETVGQINTIRSETDTAVSLFQSDIGSIGDNGWSIKPVISQIGPDGNLYYLLTTYITSNGTVERVRYTSQLTTAAPVFNPPGGTYASAQTVTLTSATADATIYYTTDGSEPTAASQQYQGSITVDTSVVIKAKAFAPQRNSSNTSTAAYTIGTGNTNQPPIVDAGEDRTVQVGENVALDGSGTVDPDGDDALIYDELWTQLSGPAVTIIDATEEVAYFIPSIPGTYRFELRLRDQQGALGRDEVEFTVVALCESSPANVLRNGNFENGLADWQFYSQSGGSFTGTSAAYECEQAAKLTINQSSSNIQLYQSNIALEPNTAYRLSFAAYSTTGRDIGIYLHKHTANYNSYGLAVDRVDLGTSWQEYTFNFTTSGFNSSVNDGRLRFWLSSYAQAGDSYWFDKIVLEKVSGSAPSATPTSSPTPVSTPTAVSTPTPVSTLTPTTTSAPTGTGTATSTTTPEPTATGTVAATATFSPTPTLTSTPTEPAAGSGCVSRSSNVIQNPDFVNGQENWNFYTNTQGNFSTAEPGYHCGAAARLQIGQSGSNVQLYQTGVQLEPNRAYRLSFAAYSSSGNDLGIYLHKHTANYTDYGLSLGQVNLTTEWQVYSFDFVTTGFNSTVSDGRLRFWLPQFAEAGDVYWLDQVTLELASSSTTPTPIATPTSTAPATSTLAATPTLQPSATPIPSATPTTSSPTATGTVAATATATTTPTITPTTTPTDTSSVLCQPSAANIIRNATFESGTADWQFYTNGQGQFQAAESGRCGSAARIQIVAAGSNVQLYQQNIALRPDTLYRLTFDAFAEDGSDLSIHLHKHTSNYGNYGLATGTINLSESWQRYTFDFVSSGFSSPVNDGRLRIWPADHDSAGAVYWFDNITLTPLDETQAAEAPAHNIYLPLVTR